MPFQPDITTTSQAGMISERNGSCRPAIRLMSISSSPDTLAKVVIGMPIEPKATGEVLASNVGRRHTRRESQSDQQGRRDCHRRAEPRAAFQETPEAEGDQQRLHPPVGRYGGHRVLDDLELPATDRQVIQEYGGQHDPADRHQPEQAP